MTDPAAMRRAPGNPAWFCGGDEHRFDFPKDPAGTCYVAEKPLGALIEVYFRTAGYGLDEDEMHDERRFATMAVLQDTVVVNLNCSSNYGVRGVSPQLLSELGPKYPLNWEFARKEYREGMEGIRWISTRDPRRQHVNIAIFSKWSGPDSGKVFDVVHKDIPLWLMYEAAEYFGVPLKRSSTYFPLP
ncbi:RES family NAD+ phosphorylase [Streptomyces lydicus]|uniref:RES family NAD+ phosphorylase n=1 Tax=Streptomyces lydicus TaxID=47763 RepID=UPI0037979EE0